MKVYSDSSTVDLTEEEGEWLRLPETAPAEALKGDEDFVYRSFQNKLEHRCSELYYSRQLTVVIYCGDSEVAIYNENGLNFIDDYYKPQIGSPAKENVEKAA